MFIEKGSDLFITPLDMRDQPLFQVRMIGQLQKVGCRMIRGPGTLPAEQCRFGSIAGLESGKDGKIVMGCRAVDDGIPLGWGRRILVEQLCDVVVCHEFVLSNWEDGA